MRDGWLPSAGVALRVVLDACVLYPFSLRDTLLRLAEVELYDPYWSGRILDEMARNLIANGAMPSAKAERIVRLMRTTFDSAEVDGTAVSRLEPAMTNHPKDRHVLAAAVAAHAEAVVTSNLKDFPAASCAPLGVEAVHPDEFLLALLGKAPDTVLGVLGEQVADLDRPPIRLDELLTMLEAVVPAFADGVRHLSPG